MIQLPWSVWIDRILLYVPWTKLVAYCQSIFLVFPNISHLFSFSRIGGELQGESCEVGIQILGLILSSGYIKGNGMATHLFIFCWKFPALPHNGLVKYPDVSLLHLWTHCCVSYDSTPFLVTDSGYSFCLEMTTGITEIPRNIFSHLYFNLCMGSKILLQSSEPDSSLNSFLKVQSSV